MRLLIVSLLLALAAPATAAPRDTELAADGTWHVEVPIDHELAKVDPAFADDLLEALAGQAPDNTTAVVLWIRDSAGELVPLESTLPDIEPVPTKEAPSPGRPIKHPGRADGGLSDKAIYLSQCHGFIWNSSLDRFATQRGNYFDTVEDLHNPEAMNQFLSIYLENAGANVYTVKERDHNPQSAVVDDGDDGYSEVGGGFTEGNAGYGHRESWAFGENPFTSGSTRKVSATDGAVATWKPNVPSDGWYAVYVSWDSDRGNATDAHYRIQHPGGTIDRWYDQTVHGSTWQFTENLWLTTGQSLTVELIADSATAGTSLSIDAVRLGGGTGVISRHRELSGRPRWEEGAVLATQYNGAPTSVYDPYNAGNGSDPTSRSRWAAWEHPAGEDALYFSWHSNATARGTARGTVTYIYEGSQGAAARGSESLAWAVQNELVDSFQELWEPTWRDRGVARAAFSEVNPGHNNEMPAALVELAFHDNEIDTSYIKHPRFRLDASRAMYRGIVRYFAERDGNTPLFLPEPPVGLAVTHTSSGELQVSWQPGPSGAPYGDAPNSYIVRTSTDGRSWDNGVAVTGTKTQLDVAPGKVIFVDVVAVNDGGVSFGSSVVGGRRDYKSGAAVLVVDAFDRFDTGLLDWYSPHPSLGQVRRMNPRRMNPHDLIVANGLAIDAAGWSFDSISDERLADIDLSSYHVVVWGAGEESTLDETFDAAQQQIIRSYLEGGGSLWVSGAEIAWDLDNKGTAQDKSFALDVLGGGMESDDAESTDAQGQGLLDGLQLDFSVQGGSPYPVEWPDVLSSQRPVIATYSTGGTAAVMGERVAWFGFPFEAIGDPATRAAVAERMLPALAPEYEPPEETTDPDTDPIVEAPRRVRLSEMRGCGCSTSPLASGWLLLLPLAFLRRRETRRGSLG